jgi:hypothetical protein
MTEEFKGTVEALDAPAAEALRTMVTVAEADLVKAFNEWMRRTIEEPESFELQWQTMKAFEAAVAAGEEPDYGTTCTEYLLGILFPRAPEVTG